MLLGFATVGHETIWEGVYGGGGVYMGFGWSGGGGDIFCTVSNFQAADRGTQTYSVEFVCLETL